MGRAAYLNISSNKILSRMFATLINVFGLGIRQTRVMHRITSHWHASVVS